MMQVRFPWIHFLHPHVICALATLGPVGYWGKAPGTLGSLAGLVLYTVLLYPLGPIGMALLLALLAYLAAGICDETEKVLMVKDPGYIILDEFVAIPWIFLGLKERLGDAPMWPYLLMGFALFRLFDILKPFGIKKLQDLPGGVGVVADDVVAAIASAVCLNIVLSVLEYFY